MISYTLLSSILAMSTAQIIKIPIFFFISRKWEWSLLFSTGGMPSSHSAAVAALSISVGMTEGWDSTLFVICIVFSSIVMHDATGVRRHAGYHAEVLNQLLQDFNVLLDGIKNPKIKNREARTQLKEILGHKPIEVFFGALLGAAIALILFPAYYMD